MIGIIKFICKSSETSEISISYKMSGFSISTAFEFYSWELNFAYLMDAIHIGIFSSSFAIDG